VFRRLERNPKRAAVCTAVVGRIAFVLACAFGEALRGTMRDMLNSDIREPHDDTVFRRTVVSVGHLVIALAEWV